MKLVINPLASELLVQKKYPDVLSVKEVQEILGVCRISVYALIENSRIQAFRIGRTYMIPKQSIKNFLNCTTTEGES